VKCSLTGDYYQFLPSRHGGSAGLPRFVIDENAAVSAGRSWPEPSRSHNRGGEHHAAMKCAPCRGGLLRATLRIAFPCCQQLSQLLRIHWLEQMRIETRIGRPLSVGV